MCHRTKIKLIAFICTLWAVAVSCSYKQNQVMFERHAPEEGIIQNAYAAAAEYKIQPQDILQVRNLQNIKYIVDDVPSAPGSAQSNTYVVEKDSTVALPVIGYVKVAGLTRFEAAKKITSVYAQNLIKNPIIDVRIVNLKVTLLGEVKMPGNYLLTKDKTTLVEILGEAGGLTPKANEKRIKIIRGEPQNPEITEVDLSDIASLSNPATLLRNGDIIHVEQNKRALRNERLQSISTIMQPALVLLNTALVIYTLSR